MSKLEQIQALKKRRVEKNAAPAPKITERRDAVTVELTPEPAPVAPTVKVRAAKKPKKRAKPAKKAAKAKASAPAPRRGRPRVEDRGKTLSDRKPWLAEGMSRATFYRRQKAARK